MSPVDGEHPPELVAHLTAERGWYDLATSHLFSWASVVRSEMVAPLLVEGSVWGAINLEELVEDAFDDEDAQLLSILANQVAAAIRSVQLVQRVSAA